MRALKRLLHIPGRFGSITVQQILIVGYDDPRYLAAEIMEEEDFTDLKVPTWLFKKAAEKIKGTKFKSVSGYVSFILEEAVLSEGTMKEQSFSKDDEEAVKERLRALGYLG